LSVKNISRFPKSHILPWTLHVFSPPKSIIPRYR
jgi:hypothetical protein